MNKGFTILETLVAFMALVMMFVGPVTLITKAIGNTYYSQNRIIASYLAVEAVEYILNVRDNNILQGDDWLNGMNTCGVQGHPHGCYIDIPNNNIGSCSANCRKIKYDSAGDYYNYTTGTDTIFSRVVKIDTPIGGLSDEAKLTVTVSWPEKTGATRTYVLEREIFNWK